MSRRREGGGRLGVLGEFLEFIRVRRSWWLLPLVLVLVVLGVFLVFAQSSPLAPFIYALF